MSNQSDGQRFERFGGGALPGSVEAVRSIRQANLSGHQSDTNRMSDLWRTVEFSQSAVVADTNFNTVAHPLYPLIKAAFEWTPLSIQYRRCPTPLYPFNFAVYAGSFHAPPPPPPSLCLQKHMHIVVYGTSLSPATALFPATDAPPSAQHAVTAAVPHLLRCSPSQHSQCRVPPAPPLQLAS